MKRLLLFTLVSWSVLALSTVGYHLANSGGATPADAQAFQAMRPSANSIYEVAALDRVSTEAREFAAARYRLDASQSKFMVRAFAGGLLWFKGHDHFIAVRDFSGEAQLVPGAINPASLQMTIRADSLVETRDVFTEQQKQIINRELREIVLETNKYPEITFKSTNVTVNLSGGQVEAKIGGDLTLHGVTRHIVIPAQVTLSGDTLRARGEFTVNRSDYNVKATSALHGTIRVRDKLKFTFDIVAHQI
ncbi:MAG: YceI family protein [Pyrinomonadaceae bacterium]|nr:YceI family protein [Pyrinomonadaceae bacterium]